MEEWPGGGVAEVGAGASAEAPATLYEDRSTPAGRAATGRSAEAAYPTAAAATHVVGRIGFDNNRHSPAVAVTRGAERVLAPRQGLRNVGSMEVVPKPPELLALHDVTEELFATLKRWFGVPDQVTLDLTEVDSAVTEMSDPVMIAALAMRKLQALHLLSTPGVRTSTDVVVTIVQDLTRALLQAPAMRLRLAASRTDWDAALADLSEEPDGGFDYAGDADGGDAPASTDERDPEQEYFQMLHGRLHDAVRAVIEASGGEITLLE